MIIEDSGIADHMAKYFGELWTHPLSADVKIPM